MLYFFWVSTTICVFIIIIILKDVHKSVSLLARSSLDGDTIPKLDYTSLCTFLQIQNMLLSITKKDDGQKQIKLG